MLHRRWHLTERLVLVIIIALLSCRSFSQPLANGKSKFLGSSYRGARSDFSKYWDQVTPDDAGKWGNVESSPGVYNWSALDNIYNYAISNGFPYKHHNLIWGQEQPSWIMSLDSASQRAEVQNWIRLVGQRYPKMTYIDVVNEPFNSPAPYRNALGGAGKTGWDWIVTAFTWARQYCAPGVKLLINEYNILQDNGVTNNYIALIDTLRSRGLVDGIGIQGHYFEFKSAAGATPAYSYSTTTLKSNLDRLAAATGLPIYISEFDINESDDNTQLQNYQTYFPLFWEDQGVKGITLWGYVQGNIWKPNAYLVRLDGSERPALQWLRTYLSSGNFQSAKSGNWEDKNTWSMFDGTSWGAAPHTPGLADGAITILSSHTVAATASDTTNKLTIASGGTLVVNSGVNFLVKKGLSGPVGLYVYGSMMNYGTVAVDTLASLLFESGGKYGHEQDGGAVPIAMWASGSTCESDSVRLTVPSNLNQNFSNFAWNCPGQVGNISLQWNGITIGGSITIQNTGTGQLQMCTPATGASDTVTIAGDVIQSGGQFTANGTSNGNTTIVINHGGNVSVTGGDFSISRGSQGGTGKTTWNLSSGSFSMSNATSQNSTTTPNGAKFLFSGSYPSTQTLTLGSGNTISSLPIEVKGGATLITGTSALSGSGTFGLDSGATLQCGNVGGLDGLLNTTGIVTLSKNASYVFNGSTAQATGKLLPDSVAGLTVNAAAGLILSKSVAITGTITIQSGTLSQSNDTLSYGANGTLSYSGHAAQTTSNAEFPSSRGPLNVSIRNTIGVTLHAPRTIAGNLNLYRGGKLLLGNNDFTASSVSNTTSSYYVVTQGTGALKLASGSSPILFPVGTKTGYAPVTVTSAGIPDTVGVSVMDDSAAAPYGGRVMVRWNTSSTVGSINDSIQFAWMSSLEDNAFANDRGGNAGIFLISNSDTLQAGSGAYASQFSTNPHSVSRGGITQLGTFYVGHFGKITSVKSDISDVPEKFGLSQNYPNPFNPSTVISYQLTVNTFVTLKIYDVLGREIETLVNEYKKPGKYEVEFDGTRFASGIYFCTMRAGSFIQTRKLVLMK